MELNFTVTNQKIKYVSNLYIVEKSRNYLTAKFSFSGNEWKNVVKTAIFKKDDTVVNVLLDESGRCNVPWEVITKGTLKVSVFGGDLVTVDTADVKILKSGYEEGNAPSEPTPDVYAQILTELQDIRSEYVTEEMLGQAVEDWLAENVVEALSPEDVQKIVYGWLEGHKTELKGEKGDAGKDGIDGATFTPKIVDGVLSWENNSNLENPTSFDFEEELGINELKEDVETLKTAIDITTTDSTTQPNSYAGRENILEIGGGESEQDSTSGKNILKNKATSTTTKGVTFTVNADGTVVVNGTASEDVGLTINSNFALEIGKSYVLSGCPSGGSASTYRIRLTDANYVYNNYDVGNGVQFEEKTGSAMAILIIYAGCTVNNLVFKPMVRLASVTDATYEPYTGGQPAPNPYYPMPIKNSKVKGARTHHKNFFGFGKTTVDVTEELRANPKQRLTFSSIGDNPNRVKCNFTGGGYSMGYIAIYGVDGTRDWAISFNVESNTTEYTPSLAKSDAYSDKERLILKFGGGNGGTNVAKDQYFVLSNIQVEEGTEATEFEAYTESSHTFSQPIDLYGRNGVKDIFTAKQTKRKFAKRVFDGSEYWNASTALTGRYFCSNLGCISGGKVLCTQAKSGNYNTTTINECYLSSNSGGQFRINTEFATVDEWKAHLASNPMEVVCELAEEVVEELPIADQIGLNSIATYDGVTHVEFICEGPQPTFKGEYGTSKVGGYTLESLLVARNNELKQNMVDERLSALEASVVNNI